MSFIVKNKFADHFQAYYIGYSHSNILCKSNKKILIIELLFDVVNGYKKFSLISNHMEIKLTMEFMNIELIKLFFYFELCTKSVEQ